jgi:hypothetical protein
MEHLPPVSESPEQVVPQKMSLAARLFNVFATPGEVFEQVKDAPVSTANWLVPGLILIVVSWIGAWLVFSQDSIQQQLREITDQAVEKQIQKGKLSEQQAEQARAMAAKFGSIGTKAGAYGAPVFSGLVVPFWGGLILWLVGNKALHGNFPYMKWVEIAGLAGMVGVLDAVVRPLLILILGNLFASPSLALFVKQFDPQNPVHGLLAIVNVMSIWALCLRALGAARLTRASFGKAALWIFGIWIMLTGLMTGFSFAMQAVFNR